MTSLAELHDRARAQGVPRYRTRSRAELEQLVTGAAAPALAPPAAAAVAAGVRLEREGPLATIVLDDRASHNALSGAALAELDELVGALAADRSVRLVALAGAGRIFSSGAAIHEFDDLPDGGRTLSERATATCDRLAGLPQPVVALLNGHAIGGGAELALAADWRLAAPAAELRFVHAGLGLVPGFGGLGRLQRLVGTSRALWIVALRESLAAEAALALGLVDEVVGAGALRARASELAAAISASDATAVAEAKRALAAGTRAAEREAFLAAWPGRKLPARR